MSFYSNLFARLRNETSSKEDHMAILEAEAFARFAGQAYYANFLQYLEDLARNIGLEDKDYESMLISQGKRAAYIEIVNYLRHREKIARERLTSDDDVDEPSDE